LNREIKKLDGLKMNEVCSYRLYFKAIRT